MKKLIVLVVIAAVIAVGSNVIYKDWYFPKYKDIYKISYDMYKDADTTKPYMYRPYKNDDNEYKKNLGFYMDINEVKLEPMEDNGKKYVMFTIPFHKVTGVYKKESFDAINNQEITKDISVRVTIINNMPKFQYLKGKDIDEFFRGFGGDIVDIKTNAIRDAGDYVYTTYRNEIINMLKVVKN